jgi:hypothetical protein
MYNLIEEARTYADNDDYFTTRNLLRLLADALEQEMLEKQELIRLLERLEK